MGAHPLVTVSCILSDFAAKIRGVLPCRSLEFIAAPVEKGIPQYIQQVRDKVAFSIHFFIVRYFTSRFCDPKLVYNTNTKINYTLEDCVVFS